MSRARRRRHRRWRKSGRALVNAIRYRFADVTVTINGTPIRSVSAVRFVPERDRQLTYEDLRGWSHSWTVIVPMPDA